jgi:predicted small lipoprotein YifL
MPEIVTIVVIMLITILMQGCGRKGPLYLEQMPAPVVVTPAQPASAPAASSVPVAPTQTQPAN